MDKWFITEEWNESDILPHGRCTAHVTAYGLMSKRRISELKFCMNRYSPYDYVDSDEFKTEQEYEHHLQVLQDNGATIERYSS